MRRAGSCCCATAAPSATRQDGTRRRRPIGSSSSSMIRRSGTPRTRVTSSPSSTRTSARRRDRHAPTWRTSGSGPASPTSSTPCSTTIWPPSASKTAGSRASPLPRDAERALHALEGMLVALVGVATGLELDPPQDLAPEPQRRGLVHARPLQVEVVNGGLVLDLDRVRAGLDRPQLVASLRDLDRVARTG